MTIEQQLADAGVPESFRSHRATTFRAERPDQRKATAVAERVVNGFKSAIFIGPTGTGKTHLAVAILATLAGQKPGMTNDVPPKRHADGVSRLIDSYGKPKGRFIGVPELLDQIRYRIDHAGVEDPLEALMDVPLLILDDLGSEKSTEWVLERLYILINHRYGNRGRLVTVVTTNYSLDQLAERGYGRIISRLSEGANTVTLTGSDERLSTDGPQLVPGGES